MPFGVGEGLEAGNVSETGLLDDRRGVERIHCDSSNLLGDRAVFLSVAVE